MLCCAARGQYVFTNFQKQNGLSTNEVFCSFKDDEGFMWFGTSRGLNRYDGSGFKVYNWQNKNTVTDITITSIAKKSNIEMWVGASNGLYIFNKQNGSFSSDVMTDTAGKTKNNTGVQKIITDAQKRHWVVTSNELFVIIKEKVTPASSVYPSFSISKNSILQHPATTIDNARKGIWVGTTKELYFINFESGKTWSAENNPGQLALFQEKAFYAICPDDKGDIWFSSEKHSLARYNNSTNKIIDIQGWMPDIKNGGLFIDSKKRLWLNNYSGKIFVLDTNGKFIRLPDASPENYKPCNILLNSISEDNENNIWLTGLNGISKLKAGSYLHNIITLPNFTANNQYAHFQINDIADAGNGRLWVCKDDGLYLLDTETGNTKRYLITSEGGRPNRFFDVKSIKGEWWCGTGDGIKILNPVTGQFRSFAYYAKEHPVKNVSAYWIYEDKRGKIWFSVWNTAVFMFDPATKKTVRVEEIRSTNPSDPVLTNSLSILENSDGKIWFGNGYKGIKIFDPLTGKFTTPPMLNRQNVLQICRDSSNSTWLAVKGHGIIKTDMDGNPLDSVAIPEISDMGFDKQGRLWVCGNEGIQFVNTVRKTVSKLAVDMGEPFHDLSGAIFFRNDKLYGSVQNKLAVINHREAGELTIAAPPLISGIRVFEKEMLYAVSNPLLNLRYNENFFSIEFSSVRHNEITSLQYAYMLKGFDKGWVHCGRRQIASYTNVPDGNYTFLVKCTGADGQWMDKETAVAIYIRPPFWKTWWFATGFLLLLAVLAWYLYRLSRSRKQKKYIDNTIDYFANSVYGQNSVTEICWDIARNCISQLHFEDCVVYLVDGGKNQLVQKAAYGPKNPKGQEIINPIEIEMGKGIVGTVAETGKPLSIKDTTKDERYIVDDERRLSELAVPILHDGKVIGVIDSENSKKNFFTEEHIKALNTIAAISANKIAEATAEAMAKENEIKVLEINKMLAESQLMALRAQMNPHFVFNCLNSIQECIVTQKYGEASKYLNKFSKLFRMVLNNSGKKLVTLAEEKEVLELYLELEQMRFEKGFEYAITIDEKLDADEVLIPSMLVQPYVENALWHGLMHKEGDRKLSIGFRLIKEEVFECVIDDNGIGRKRSFELKAGQSKAKRHESKGLAISKDRLDVLERQGYHASLQITDKQDQTGDATGTRITIELSTELTN